MCIGQVISQYHEENGEKIGEIILGKFSSEYQWNGAAMEVCLLFAS